MPYDISLRGPIYTFECYSIHEAKQLGLIDSWNRPGTYAPVSTVFEHGEGKLLTDWIDRISDAILIATGRYQITVYRPKSKLILLSDEEIEAKEKKDTEDFYKCLTEKANPLSEGIGGPNAKYCEGSEGVPLSGGNFADINAACDAILPPSEKIINSNDLFENKSKITKPEWLQLKIWAKELQIANPEAFSVGTIQANLDCDKALAERLFEQVKIQALIEA